MLGLGAVTGDQAIYPQGAGRWLDWAWPPYAGTGTASALGRGGMNTAQNAATGSTGTPTIGIAKYGGAPCTVINPGAGGWSVGFNDRLVIMTERPGGPLGGAPACWEFYAIMACDHPTAPILGDTGICISDFASGYVDKDGANAAAGVRFGPVGPGAAELRMRAINGGAYSVREAVSATVLPDFSLFNRYALRIVGGLATQDPYIVALINGTEVSQRYSLTNAAGVFPQPDAVSSANVGYQPFFSVRPGGAGILGNMALIRFGIIGAGSLNGLL